MRESFSEFRLLNNDDVIELVKKCAKYRALEPMSALLVPECIDELFPVIKQMINQSLGTASFPDSWEEGKVNHYHYHL